MKLNTPITDSWILGFLSSSPEGKGWSLRLHLGGLQACSKKGESRQPASLQQLFDPVPACKGHLPETRQTARVTLAGRRA